MHMMLQEERCPVAADLIGRLYAAHPAALPAVIQSIPSAMRAPLAMYCSRRAHLAAIGRAVAAQCSESELEGEAGKAGLRLFAQARERSDAVAGPARGRRAVSLSTGMLRRVVRDEPDDADVGMDDAVTAPDLVPTAA